MSKLKICLIGCGRIALSHLNAAKQSGRVEAAAAIAIYDAMLGVIII